MRRLAKNLLESSIDAFVLSLGIINNPSISYRLESFVFLFCNAWELLMKAKLHQDREMIFYRKKKNQPRKSLSLDDCLNKIFTSNTNPIKRNIMEIAELRNNAMHLVIPYVSPDILGLFQAGVLNFTIKLQEWFNISLSDRVTPGMMALTYDFNPEELSFEHAKISKRLPAETIKWIKEFQQRIYKTKLELKEEDLNQFHIPINFTLAIVHNPKKADIVLSAGREASEQGVIIEVPKDPDRTHPNRQKEVIEKVNKELQGQCKINQYDIRVIRKLFNVDKNSEWFYQSRIAGRSPQYSDAFVDWLVENAKKDQEFFEKRVVNTKNKNMEKTNIKQNYYSLFQERGINPKQPIREQEPNPLPERKELDDIIFDILGLTEQERKEVYWAVCELVKNRLEKARSV